jgi:hypothetical protein
MDTILGVLLTGFFTLAAAFVAYYALLEQQRSAQRAEATLRRANQEFDCKRTALVRASNATSKYFLFLASALDRPIEEIQKGECATEFTAAHTELHLYVSMETIDVSLKLTREIGALAMIVIRGKFLASLVQEDIKATDTILDNIQENIDRMQDEIQVLLADAQANRSEISHKYVNKAKMYGDKSPLIEAKMRSSIELAKMRGELGKELMSCMASVMPTMSAMMTAARKELHMDSLNDRYEKSVSKNVDASQNALAELQAFVDKTVAERIAAQGKST